ncbi:HNH endonuclease signature motif containing protein [Pseudonocardia charpentierae]|uniref:HNH endonuclease n=1 Tax=Pseudonocardia charpentierae TaxID=3075545 RepID=A0ABU2N6N8_9PSEU|nr:HNH endonuclease [Pseudonocardia sp. DSM 45834]MDT0349601.1 HNH endonuclease [Pseudonocardia sp. DSM 45834]
MITPEADGMAALWALLTATEAAGAFTWLTRLARGLGSDDPRSMDARRADILTACELVGHAPIPASLARDTATESVWQRLVTDPLSGTLLDHGRSTYHPPAGLADHVRARDVYCRFPGCRRTAVDAELDHILAWSDGGTTSDHNLAAYCTHHHRLKHHAGWQVHANPDGSLTWTTPTGHQRTTTPHDYRPEPAPEPASPPCPTTNEPGPDPPRF